MIHRCFLALVILSSVCATHSAAQIVSEGQVALSGSIERPENLSGLAFHGNLLVACPDEGALLNVFRRQASDRYVALPPIQLDDPPKIEIDMEGVASDGDALYVIGAHCLARQKPDEEDDYKKNRTALTEVKDQKSRYQLLRIRLDEVGTASAVERVSLRKLLKADPHLGLATAVPSKENGVDIEGIAVYEDKLYLGFRGPVLRDNYVPLMVLDFDHPNDYELRFVRLGGRGIRDLAAVEDGILILAGPVGDGEGNYELFLWNTRDGVPGNDSPDYELTALGVLEPRKGTKPEGITVVGQSDDHIELLLVRDGQSEPQLERLRVTLP